MDFEPIWLNLIRGFTLTDVYQQESEVKVNGVPQERKDTLTCYVFEKDGVVCEIIVSEDDNYVLTVEFYVSPGYIEQKKLEEKESQREGD